jgi:hypothetical protein
MTGDGPKEMDHDRQMAINIPPVYEDIEVMRSYTIPNQIPSYSNNADTAHHEAV